MYVNTREVEFRLFAETLIELRDALAAKDFYTVRLAAEELEAIQMHTDWPTLRARVTAELDKIYARECFHSLLERAL